LTFWTPFLHGEAIRREVKGSIQAGPWRATRPRLLEGRIQLSRLDTMKILDILDKQMIIPQLTSRNKEGVLRELVRVLAQVEKQVDEERMTEILLERESLGSTGIGEGVAIPHGKSKDVKKLLASFGRSLPGLDFQSMDGKPAHLFFLLVAPENSAGIHLKALARISRLMKDQTFRKRLMEANSVDEIYSLFSEGDEKY
jgi:PTS system nitrogen regulatory IIA component